MEARMKTEENFLEFADEIKNEILFEPNTETRVGICGLRVKNEGVGNETREETGKNEKISPHFADEIEHEIYSRSGPQSETNITRKRSSIRKPKSSYNSTFPAEPEGNFEVFGNSDKVSEEAETLFGRRDCDICKISFRFYCSYEEHFREKHPDKRPYSCPSCDLSYTLKQHYIRHVRMCHPEVRVVDFLSLPKLKIIKCELCDAELKGEKALESHAMAAHNGVKTKKCADCEASFFRMSDLNRHRYNKHPNSCKCDPFRCEFCKVVFRRSDDLEQHRKVCREEQKKAIKYRRSVRERKKKSEEDILDINSIPDEKSNTKSSNEVTYACSVCGEEFTRVGLYEAHVQTFHPEAKPFRCSVCGSGFVTKSVMTQHFKSMHGPKTISCSYCASKFGLRRDLSRHQRTCGKNNVSKSKTFFCNICMKWLKGLSIVHKSKHDDYDYCEFCDRRFHRKNNPEGLSNHVGKRHPNRDNAAAGVNVLLSAAHILDSQPQDIK